MEYLINLADLKNQLMDAKCAGGQQPLIPQVAIVSALIAITERLGHIAELMEKTEEKKG